MFLDHIIVTKRKLYASALEFTRWEKYAEVIYKDQITKREVLELLLVELHFGKRLMIIGRLYSRFSKIRYREEKAELYIPLVSSNQALYRPYESWDKTIEIYAEKMQDEKFVLQLLVSERTDQRRAYMLNLLFGRYTNLRRQRELKELTEWKVKKQQKNTFVKK